MKDGKKSILILGGTSIQLPIIQLAKEMGLYVITCDNKPSNPGHKLADEYHNVSIIDKDAVLALAKAKEVDAVVNYILEAGIQTAAYVNEMLGKPTSPYDSVRILSNKTLFRTFLRDNNFAVPRMFSCHTKEEALRQMTQSLAENAIDFPVVVKPCDLWGSRGVSRVDSIDDYDAALDHAFSNSIYGEVIVEEFVEADGCPLEGDAFAVDGKLVSWLWADVYHDAEAENPITPLFYTYPTAKPQAQIAAFNAELQRLITILGMKTNAYNVEARIGRNGKVYLMEVAPRDGGNEIPLTIQLATGVDMTRGTLLSALGIDCKEIVSQRPCNGFWGSYLLHSNAGGTFEGVDFNEDFRQNHLKAYLPYMQPGDHVEPYSGTNCTIGMFIARYDTREEVEYLRQNIGQFVNLTMIK